MVSKTLFPTGYSPGSRPYYCSWRNSIAEASKVKPSNTINEAGGRAYSLTDEGALAQYIVTSCFNKTYYASDVEQLEKVLLLSQSCDVDFLAKAAVYSHEIAGMKDSPALLLAVLASRAKTNPETGKLFEKIFPRVITNGKMLFNFVRIIRSGVTGRRSFGTVPKRAIRRWLESKSSNQLFTSSIGANPSMADVIKLVHPKPESDEKKSFYAYLIGKNFNENFLPCQVRDFEEFKRYKKNGNNGFFPVPNVPFQMLTALNLTREEWVQIAYNMTWNVLRQNLNTLARHGVFDVRDMTEHVAATIANPDLVRKHNVFPYQILTSYLNTPDIPNEIRNALQDALEVATENVPSFSCNTAVCLDTSGSMNSAITGYREGSTSKMRCVDVASLIGATIARKNKDTLLIPFDTQVHDVRDINTYDTIMTNAQKLSRFGGGGTDMVCALSVLNGLVSKKPELVIYVSDNQSWFNSKRQYTYFQNTGMAQEWANYKRKTPNAKLVLIDIQPCDNTQVEEQEDVLNIGSWSDSAWLVIEKFVKNNEISFLDNFKSVEI